MTSDNYPLARQDNIVIQELENELLIYDLQKNKAYCLNATSAMVWRLCDGKNSIADISRSMSDQLKLTSSDEFVWLALDVLRKGDLLTGNEEFELEFSGFNRREAIKKIGLSSMIAFPLISSVVAPLAINAQSVLPLPPFAVCENPDPNRRHFECPDFPCESGNCAIITGPNLCCVSSATSPLVFAPGETIRGFENTIICYGNQQDCSNAALSTCCSGTATVSAGVPPCFDEVVCVCN